MSIDAAWQNLLHISFQESMGGGLARTWDNRQFAFLPSTLLASKAVWSAANWHSITEWIEPMADHVVPHFQNTSGHDSIAIGAREFMCIGANPPFDHPHIFLDMGDGDEIVCPYCSTLYKYNPALKPTESSPNDCLWTPEAA